MTPDDQQGQPGAPGEPGEPGKSDNGQGGAGGKGGKGGEGGEAERSTWTDQRLEDKFEVLIDAIDRNTNSQTWLIRILIGFLVSSVLVLLAAVANLAVQLAGG